MNDAIDDVTLFDGFNLPSVNLIFSGHEFASPSYLSDVTTYEITFEHEYVSFAKASFT